MWVRNTRGNKSNKFDEIELIEEKAVRVRGVGVYVEYTTLLSAESGATDDISGQKLRVTGLGYRQRANYIQKWSVVY